MDDEMPNGATPAPHHECVEPVVMGQIGQSLDGKIATVHGESKYINGKAALDRLHALRAGVDAVVVGVGTVAADDPLLTVRRVAGRSPARVVLDPSGRADPGARCFAQDGVRRVVVRRTGVTAAVPAGVETIEIDSSGAFAPARVIAALRGLGFARILVEGGARTLSAFIEAGCLDVVHVFVSPVIIGSGRSGLELAPVASLSSALRPATRVELLPDGDVWFECRLRASSAETESHGQRDHTSRPPERLRAAG
jgi:riboflavin-specific deaminase-like protein